MKEKEDYINSDWGAQNKIKMRERQKLTEKEI